MGSAYELRSEGETGVRLRCVVGATDAEWKSVATVKHPGKKQHQSAIG